MTDKKAILIIDVLAGIFQLHEPLHDPEGFLERLEGLLAGARRQGIPVIHLQGVGPKGSPFEKGTDGQRIHPRVTPEPGETVIEKSNPDAFHGTRLDAQLRELGVRELIICGFATEGCVDTTVRSAFGRDYTVRLVSDGHTTTRNEILEAEDVVRYHNLLLQRFATVLRTEEVDFEKP